MGNKLKFLFLKLLLLLFLIYFLVSGAIFLLLTTTRVNFETTVTDDVFVPSFHVISMVPKFRDKYFTLPELEKVSVIKKTDGLLVKTETYIFNFIFKNKKSDSKLKSSISFSINKKEDLNVEQLQEKINDALQNNKNFKYEVFSGKNFSFIRDYVIWSLLFLFIIIFAFIKVLKAEKKSKEQDKKNITAKETTLSNEINDSIIK